MMIGIVGPMTSCMKVQGIYTKFKVKYSNKGTLRSIISVEEETSTLVVDSEEEEGEEVWVEVEVRSFVITVHNQVIWKVTVKTLIPLAVIATHLNMLLGLRNVLFASTFPFIILHISSPH
jgi:hypothetical protein